MTRIPDLPSASNLDGDEIVAIVQGNETRQVKINKILGTNITLLQKNIAGNSNIVMAIDEASAAIYEFSGVLTGNINVVFPVSVRNIQVDNLTTGNYTITLKTPLQSGGVVVNKGTMHLYCNGSIIEDANEVKLTKPAVPPSVIGSRGGNVALASLLTQLSDLGLITDNTTA